MTNRTVILEYKAYLENNKSPKTIHNYEAILTDLSNFLQDKPFKQIPAKDLGRFLQWKRNRKIIGGRHRKKAGSLSDSTYALYVLLLKLFYCWLFSYHPTSTLLKSHSST